jgi:oligopeptide/dipeptide ABC transporter ATP-binding protein
VPDRPVRVDVTLLELRDVEVVYGRHGRHPLRAVAGASLTVERGQIIGLVGESGCGKSSLARVGVGLLAPAAGEVRFEDQRLTPLGRAARPAREARLQMVFQNPYASLNPRRRIGTQIRAAMTLGGRKDARDERVAELLEQVGMSPGAARRYPHEFSGGQRQRIAIARALAADPSCIVLDEPLSSLDASAQAQVANLLVRLSRELDLGLLLISHDLAIVRHVCDAIAVMYLGLIVETGPAAEVWSSPKHPYTEALIAAIPHADGAGDLPLALPGEVPDPAQPPSGCRFHPRCPYVFDRCQVEVPPLYALAPARRAACFLRDPQTSKEPA